MFPLFEHQEDGVNFIINRGGSGALFWEMGLGKSRGALEIFSRLKSTTPLLRMLIVAPLSLLNAAWREDLVRFGYPFSFVNLHDDPDYNGGWTIMAVNYEAFLRRSVDILKPIYESTRRGDEWLCVLDESSRIKSAQAKTTKIMLKAAALFKYRIVMSGTPAPNSEMEYWPQINFVEPDLMGSSMTAFRARYFHMARGSQKMPVPPFMSRQQAYDTFRHGWEYSITPESREALMREIAPVCHWAKKKDCLDLPDQIDEVREVDMAPDQARIYRKMERELVVEIAGQKIAAPVALTKLMKLRQISSGFLYNALGESFETIINAGADPKSALGPSEYAEALDNPKLKELFDVIDDAGDQPIIIWINFHWEQIKICHELYKKFGEESVVTLSALTKDKDASIDAFKAGRARFLVAHPRSAAHGLTFVNCSLQIFFSLDYSWEAFEQARARIHRVGQTKKCTYIYLVARGTIDEGILKTLRQKGGAQEIISEFLARNKPLIPKNEGPIYKNTGCDKETKSVELEAS